MAEETPAETPVEEPVAPASATPEPETSPEYVSKSDLGGIVDQIVERVTKSQRDSIQARVSNEVGEKLSKFDEVVEALRPHLPENFDASGVKREAFIDNLMRQSTSDTSEPEQPSPPQEEAPTPASVPPGRESEIAAILETHSGLSGSEPELLEYAEANKGKPWYQVGQGFEDLAKSIAARTAGTPAGVVAPQGQVSNPDLEKEFRTELNGLLNPVDSEGKAIQGQRRNPNQLRALQAKYAEQGLKPEDMDITPVTKNMKEQGYTIRDWVPPDA